MNESRLQNVMQELSCHVCETWSFCEEVLGITFFVHELTIQNLVSLCLTQVLSRSLTINENHRHHVAVSERKSVEECV